MLGIDACKKSLTGTLLDPHLRTPLWCQTVENSGSGYERLHQQTPKECAWVLEPTGRYGQALVRFAGTVGRTVLLAEPRRAKAFLRSVNYRAKTDPLDSEGLALYALACPLRHYPQKSDAVEKLDQLLSARRGLSRALTSLEQQRRELPYARESLQPAIGDLKGRLVALDARIAQAAGSSEIADAVDRLRDVPGIGPVTAPALASRLLSKDFSHYDSFVAYLGLDVRVNQSGMRNSRGRLTKHGDAELRRLLFNCARAAVRAKNASFKEQYVRERAKGLSSTAAYCAVARKLAKICWALTHYQRDYQAERVYARPSPQEDRPSRTAQEDMRSPA